MSFVAPSASEFLLVNRHMIAFAHVVSGFLVYRGQTAFDRIVEPGVVSGLAAGAEVPASLCLRDPNRHDSLHDLWRLCSAFDAFLASLIAIAIA